MLHYSLLSLDMSKKSEQITFRTTFENVEYLKLLQESDDRTQGWVLNKMIEVLQSKGVKKVSDIK